LAYLKPIIPVAKAFPGSCARACKILWVFGHADIAKYETTDQYAKDAPMPDNEAEFPSHASHSHL
jgi:hypothetical protein